MTKNKKQTSSEMATLASNSLHDPSASYTQKRLAESALSQHKSEKQTGKEMEELASTVLNSSKYNEDTVKLAKCVKDQAPKN